MMKSLTMFLLTLFLIPTSSLASKEACIALCYIGDGGAKRQLIGTGQTRGDALENLFSQCKSKVKEGAYFIVYTNAQNSGGRLGALYPHRTFNALKACGVDKIEVKEEQ